MFKMYFVKTKRPNVYRRIDEPARILLDMDIYPVSNSLTFLQDYYCHSLNIIPWNEFIGFKFLDDNHVTTTKPIDEIMNNAKQLKIDIQFVETAPDIKFNPDVPVDIRLREVKINNEYVYFSWWGNYRLNGILNRLPFENAITKRIKAGFAKYDLHMDDDGIVHGPKILIENELDMVKDLQENFNINLFVERRDWENY